MEGKHFTYYDHILVLNGGASETCILYGTAIIKIFSQYLHLGYLLVGKWRTYKPIYPFKKFHHDRIV